MQPSIRYVRNLITRCLCVVYLFAFISYYIQIPGLYGDNGILPARFVLESTKFKTLADKVHYKPTLLWLAPYLGLNVQGMMEVIALFGMFLSFNGFISQKFCTMQPMALLWSLYYSLYQVGQDFNTQWDRLLLETGFIAILLAPFYHGIRRSPSDRICMWLMKWTLFRFMVSAGVLKLTKGSPKWWTLDGFAELLENNNLPAPLAWSLFQAPTWILRICTLILLTALLILPFMFFAPIRSVRVIGFTVQLFLLTITMLVGNFNQLTLLMITLCLSLLDDKFFFGKSKLDIRKVFLSAIIYAAIVNLMFYFGNLDFDLHAIAPKLIFNRQQFDEALKFGIPIAMYVLMLSLAVTIIKALSSAITDASHNSSKVVVVITTLLFSCVAVILLAASIVPLAGFHPAANASVTPSVRELHKRLERFQLTNHYGDPRLYSAEGRLEIVFEGADNIEGPWQEYYFRYRPSNVNRSLPFVAPYSPRLDFNLWYATRATGKEQAWVKSFVNRLLQGREEVLNLLDRSTSVYARRQPPKYVRATLYRYRYTSWSQRLSPAWWQRERLEEFLPPYTRDNPVLLDQLKSTIYPSVEKPSPPIHPLWARILKPLRVFVTRFDPVFFNWSVFSTGCVLILTA